MHNITMERLLGKKKPGDLGLELEVESLTGVAPVAEQPWGVKNDDSLRHYGLEYYTVRPIKCDATKLGKIRLLTDELNSGKYPIVKDSPRTSLHVHVNILRHTPLQVWTAAVTYWLLDSVLIKYCGEAERGGNVFCLRVKDSESVLKEALKDIQGKRPFSYFDGENVRYSSQNLNAIWKFGSIEYRGMRGTIDPVIIDTWSTEMYNIVHRSKRYSGPAEVLDTYINLGAENFMKTVLTTEFVKTLYDFGSPDKLLKEAAGMLCELCYAYDWPVWQSLIDKRYAQGHAEMLATPDMRDRPPPPETNYIPPRWQFITDQGR